MVALALACGSLIERFIGLQSVLLVFLVAIIGSAIVWGLFPSLFACVLSVKLAAPGGAVLRVSVMRIDD